VSSETPDSDEESMKPTGMSDLLWAQLSKAQQTAILEKPNDKAQIIAHHLMDLAAQNRGADLKK